MTLADALDLQADSPLMISFVGGGGKTTAMFRLAFELKARGQRVLVTTTTAIFKPDHDRYDELHILTGSRDISMVTTERTNGSITVLASGYRMQKDKLDGLDAEKVDELVNNGLFDAVLVEADGSRRMPVKAPADHEPVIPSKTTMCIGVTGFDCYNKSADSSRVHRLEEFLAITGAGKGATINKNILLSLVASPLGLFKGTPAGSRKIWLINKADDAGLIAQAVEVAGYILKESTVPDMVLIASVQQGEPVKKVLYRN